MYYWKLFGTIIMIKKANHFSFSQYRMFNENDWGFQNAIVNC